MKKQNYSLLWTVAFHLTLSAICVTANTLYRKDGDVELSITGENDGTIGNELISADLEDENSVHGEYIDQERVCLIDAYRQCRNANRNIASFLPASPVLARGNLIGVLHGTTGNYKLSFDIVPRSTVSGWGNIFHFTTGNGGQTFGIHAPGLWFFPGTTKLHCFIGDSSDNYRNFAINPHHELPLNVHTKVTLECNGPSVKLTVGGHVYTAVQPNHRFAGKLLVYAGNTYEQNANAEINGFEYEILPATKAKADVALLSDMQVQTPKDETSILHRENEDN